MANCGDIQYATGDVVIGGNLVVAGTVTSSGGSSGGNSVAIPVIDSTVANGIWSVTSVATPVPAPLNAVLYALTINVPITPKPATPTPAAVLLPSTPYLFSGSLTVEVAFTYLPTTTTYSPTFDFYLAPYAVALQGPFVIGINGPYFPYTSNWSHVKYVNESEVLSSVSLVSPSTCVFTFPVSCVLTTPATSLPVDNPFPMQLSLGIYVSGPQTVQTPNVGIATITGKATLYYRDTTLTMVQLALPPAA